MPSLKEAVDFIRKTPLSQSIQNKIITFLIRLFVPFIGTAKVQVLEIKPSHVKLKLKNKRRVQNHMKSVHASAINLLAESCTGLLLTMNLPKNCKFATTYIGSSYHKRTVGDITADIYLLPEQKEQIENLDKGEVILKVIIQDSQQTETSEFDVTWSWKK